MGKLLAGYILSVLVKEIFLLFYRHKTWIIFKKNPKKKNRNTETPTRDQPTLQHMLMLVINPTT